MYKGLENHINTHSGYEPISLTKEAIFLIVGFTTYNLILLLLSRQINRKKSSIMKG